MAGRWFPQGTPVSSTNKTDRHDITKIMFKVALSTIKPTNYHVILISRHFYFTVKTKENKEGKETKEKKNDKKEGKTEIKVKTDKKAEEKKEKNEKKLDEKKEKLEKRLDERKEKEQVNG